MADPDTSDVLQPKMEEDDDDDDANDLFAAEEDDANMDEDEVLPPSMAAMAPLGLHDPQQQQQLPHNMQQQQHPQHVTHTLPDRIIMPSPFAQHNTGTSRFRTAFARILADPVNDTEAWLAVITETSTCYASIADKASPDSYAKLDWVESCYGALIYRFPYAVRHITGIAEILLQQIVAIRTGLVGGGMSPTVPVIHITPMEQRSRQCEAKLAHIFQKYLDVTPSSLSSSAQLLPAAATEPTSQSPLVLCAWVVELWLVYIQKVQHEMTYHAAAAAAADPKAVREAITAAYDRATAAAGDAHHNQLLWTSYRDYVQSWSLLISTSTTPHDGSGSTTNVDHALASKQMQQLRSVYQRIIVQPMPGLDAFWQEYESFEKQQSEALAAALLQELAPKYQHARTIYLERTRVLSSADDAQLGRLATPPVMPPNHATEASSSGGGAASAASGSATTTTTSNETDYHTKLLDEYHLLRLWKTRCAYERTNPGRLGPIDLQRRIRHAYCEMACTLTRHVETWHMWSTWELLLGNNNVSSSSSTSTDTKTSVSATATTATNDDDGTEKGTNASWPLATTRAIQVLQLGQELIPDATLLAYAEAQIVELHQPTACPAVLDKFLERSPNTLGFILYQQLVRRYQGQDEARAVFARARRTLINPESKLSSSSSSLQGSSLIDKSVNDKGDNGMAEGDAADMVDGTAKSKKEENGKRWVVTNRLDESIGGHGGATSSEPTQTTLMRTTDSGDGKSAAATATALVAGNVTWHLYAAHAVMEHRFNRAPVVAARVYELGLRKHASFLTIPPYIQRYAQLLLELNDMVNLRALLTRAVAACQADDGSGSSSSSSNSRREALASLWDMMLHFESIGGSDAASVSALRAIEQKRREALLGPDVEDVATGGLAGSGDSALIGAQKSTIAEQLIRSEGYDTSSRIVNGMKRLVDVLAVNGHWGTGDYESVSRHKARNSNLSLSDHAAQFSGGKSDASYQKRLQFEQLIQAGLSPDAALTEVGGKMLTARERLGGAGASGAGMGMGGPGGMGGAAGGTAIMLAIQQSADWLRPLLLLLPASQLRLPIVAKPPPHLTEMALSALRSNALPAERPADDVTKKGAKRQISMNNDGSSDEEDGGGTSGYGAAFRSRQQARMVQNGTTHLS